MKINRQFGTLLYRLYLTILILATICVGGLTLPLVYENLTEIETYDPNNYSKLLKLSTGTIETGLSIEEQAKGFLNGTHGLNKTKPTLLLDPRDNMLYEFNFDKVAEALRAGFTFVSEPLAKSSFEAMNSQRRERAMEMALFFLGIPLSIWLLRKWIVWLFHSFLADSNNVEI